jgi:hypothetical protein
MKRLRQVFVLVTVLLLSSAPAMASLDVDAMTNKEVSEYAVRMSAILEKIQLRHLCLSEDTRCLRAEFSRHGISYDDKELVKKRLVIMLGSMQ